MYITSRRLKIILTTHYLRLTGLQGYFTNLYYNITFSQYLCRFHTFIFKCLTRNIVFINIYYNLLLLLNST